MNNLTLWKKSSILVKLDTKTQEFLNEHVSIMREKWIQKQGDDFDPALLAKLETSGDNILPYEKQLIVNYDEIMFELKDAMEDNEQVKLTSTIG